MKTACPAAVLCLSLVLGGCVDLSSQTSGAVRESSSLRASQSFVEATGRTRPKVDVPNGPPPRKLVVEDLIVGSGAAAKAGDLLTVEYFGFRYTGEPFSESWEERKPFKFRLGSNDPSVAPGWERGLEGMRTGGRRKLIIPPELLYHGGAPPEVEPDDAIVYVIDLLVLD